MLQKLFGFGRSALSAQVKTVTPQELQRRLQNGESVILIDVRTPHEYRQEGHIQGSRLIPLAELPQRSDKLPKDRSIICVCHSGSRSQVACKQLVSQGFTDVTNLVGGMIAWRRAGFSTKRS